MIGPIDSYFSEEGKKVPYLDRIEDYLYRNNDLSLELAVDEILRYIMVRNSTKDIIWNPNTNILVKIDTPLGRKCLEELGCKIKISYEYK